MIHVELQGPRLEVRCCCDPSRLYGWLPLNGGAPFLGQRFRFSVPPRVVDQRVGFGPAIPGGEVLLEVDALTLEGGYATWALKYHGDDLSFVEKAARLRHVPGFEPSPEVRALLPDPRERA